MMTLALTFVAAFLGAALGCATVGWQIAVLLRRVHASVTGFAPVAPRTEGQCSVCGEAFFNPTDAALQPICAHCVAKELP